MHVCIIVESLDFPFPPAGYHLSSYTRHQIAINILTMKTHILAITLTLLVTFLFSSAFSQNLVINEIMASNATTIADEDGDFEDWIELYNYGTEPVNLAGYGLSDSYGNPFKWVFPEVIVGAGEFLLVFASGKNRTDPNQILHTNYSISAAGEEITLTDPQGNLIDELSPIAIPTDVSYGRMPNATGSWFFFAEPTPGSSNITQAFSEVLTPPIFSHPGGFYAESFFLSLTHPDPDVTIVYTLDGSIPDHSNLEGTIYPYKNSYPQHPGQPFGPLLGNVFQSLVHVYPIGIYDRSTEPNRLTNISSTVDFSPNYFPSDPVKKAFVVRAVATKENAISSTAVSNTYFVNQLGTNPHVLPVVSLSIQENALFDYYDGIYAAGVVFDNWRLENPNVVLNDWQKPANYFRRGDEWEYPANVEFFANDSNTSVLSQSIGVRIHGGATRFFPAKSF